MLKLIGLLAVLMLAQQGSLVHELGHSYHTQSAESKLGWRGSADTTCPQCPAFAQVVTPAVSHSFLMPVRVLIATQRISELRIAAIEAAVPHPRSRGPPSFN